jgi:PKD repeat protein
LVISATLLSPAVGLADGLSDFTHPTGCRWGILQSDEAEGSGIAKTSTGYIVSGYQPHPPAGTAGNYGVLWKLTGSGGEVFYEEYEPPAPEVCPVISGGWACTRLHDVSVVPTSGGGEEYAATGYKYHRFTYPDSVDPGITREAYVKSLWLLKTNAGGSELLNIDLGGRFPQQVDPTEPYDIYYTAGNAILPLYDPGTASYDLLLGGYIDNHPYNYGWLLRANQAGVVEWERQDVYQLAGGWEGGVYCAVPAGGGHILGTAQGMIRLDNSGDFSWGYGFGVDCRSVLVDGEGFVGVCGNTLVKLDADGNEIWNRSFPTAVQFVDVMKLADGYAVLGTTTVKGHGSADIWLLRTNADGHRIWDIARGGEHGDLAAGFAFDGGSEPGFVIAGSASYDWNGDSVPERHIWVFKTKAEYVAPVAAFTYSPERIVVEQPVTFDASGSRDPDGTVAVYSWDFGDGQTDKVSGAHPPAHRYDTPGDYTVTLTVIDNEDVETTVSHTVSVAGLYVQWERTFDNTRYGNTRCDPPLTSVPNEVFGNDMVMTDDGGFAIAGYSAFCHPMGAGHRYDPWLFKTDERGMFLWEQDFVGFGGGDALHAGAAVALAKTTDGLILTGFTGWTIGNPWPDDKDLWVSKTAADGTPQWFRTFGGDYADEGRGVATLEDGFLIAGYRFSGLYSPANSRAWLFRLDATGNEVPGESTVFSEEGLFFNTIEPLGGGGFLLTGGYDILYGYGMLPLFSVNQDGSVNWLETWEPEDASALYNTGHWVARAADGGFVVGGAIADNMCLMKTDEAGNDDWRHVFDEDFDFIYDDIEAIFSGVVTADGGYLLGGMYHETRMDYDFHLIRLDAAGNEKWRWIPNTGPDAYPYEYPRAIVALADGSYVVMVTRWQHWTGDPSDVWLVKVGPSPDPIAAFEADYLFGPLSGPAPLLVRFRDMSSSGSPPYTYAWEFGDGTGSTEQNPVKTYNTAGVYTVRLTVTDAGGRSDTYERISYVRVGGSELPGDVDGDCDVDGLDTALLAAAFGSRPGDLNWNANADFNEDRVIDEADLAVLAEDLGEVCEEG